MYTNSIYALIFVLVVGAWAISELLGAMRWSKVGDGKKRDRGSMAMSLGIGLLGLVLSFLSPVLFPRANIMWQSESFFVGLTVAVMGICWRWYAILTLGRYFTGMILIQVNHAIIQHGPYKLIRHPSYTGALLIAIGIGFMIGSWVSLSVIVAGLFIGLLYRIPVEEMALRQVPGYEEYMQRTKRLIPFLF